MSGSKVEIPWGADDTIELDLPEAWRVMQTMKPRHPGELPEFDAELDRAMNEPIGLPPLREYAAGKNNACIVIDDRTRPAPVSGILPRVIDDLNKAGIKDDDILILIALGTHRYMTPEEITARVGQGVVDRVKIENHEFNDRSMHKSVGNTPTHNIPVTFNKKVVEADLVVSVGCIEAHEIAGFGGGYKNIMPGVAGPEPIHATHNSKFQKQVRISHSGMPREICKFRQAVDECGALLGDKVFIVNTVLDPVNVQAIVAGHPIEAHQKGTEIYAKMARVSCVGLSDVVILGSRPLDVDLRVSMKGSFNAATALKPGGLLITVSRAEEGMGDLRLPNLPKIAGTMMKLTPTSVLESLSPRFSGSPDQAMGSVSLMKILKTAKRWLFLTTNMEGTRTLSNIGIEFFTDKDKLMERAKKLKPKAEVNVMPQAGASYVSWD